MVVRNPPKVPNRLGDSGAAGRGRFWAVAILLSLALTQTLPGQCSMCKASLTQSVQGAALAQGLNSGILFLLCVPFVLVSTIALLVWYSRKTQGSSGLDGRTGPSRAVSAHGPGRIGGMHP